MFGFVNHQKKVDICLNSETGDAVDVRLNAGINHVETNDTAEAWGLDSSHQCKDSKTGRYIQFVSSLSCDPLPIYSGRPVLTTDMADIASQTEDQELNYVESGNGKSSQLLWVGICCAILSLTLLIAVLLKMRTG